MFSEEAMNSFKMDTDKLYDYIFTGEFFLKIICYTFCALCYMFTSNLLLW